MKKAIYKIQFFDYWHTGSGLAGGTYADSIVNKDETDLPIIPGRTIKGLLKDAANSLQRLNNELITNNFIETVFGKEGIEANSFFTNATLSKELSENIKGKSFQKNLYHVISSTAIDANGQAQEHSLRQLEVTIPLVLYGVVENISEAHIKELEQCFNWVKELGINRNRGLGRCQISLVK